MSNPKERLVLDLGKRVFSEDPPLIVRPSLRGDLTGFSTVDDLIGKLSRDRRPAFPYERELALYLLLIASIWPGDRERLLAAARIFSGALNFHISRAQEDAASSASRRYLALRQKLSPSEINSYNENFFVKFGGPQSLLFSPSVEAFHRDLWKRIAELTLIHDFAEYIFKSSILSKRISSATFGYHAIANNIFAREGGYGVAGGPKRKRGQTTAVKTAESVRAKCKSVPATVILSFIMTRWYGVHLFDPAHSQFLITLFRHEGTTSSGLRIAMSIIRDRLLKGRSKLNRSLIKWAGVDSPRYESRHVCTHSVRRNSNGRLRLAKRYSRSQ